MGGPLLVWGDAGDTGYIPIDIVVFFSFVILISRGTIDVLSRIPLLVRKILGSGWVRGYLFTSAPALSRFGVNWAVSQGLCFLTTVLRWLRRSNERPLGMREREM
jgi:hypothetical protein